MALECLQLGRKLFFGLVKESAVQLLIELLASLEHKHVALKDLEVLLAEEELVAQRRYVLSPWATSRDK